MYGSLGSGVEHHRKQPLLSTIRFLVEKVPPPILLVGDFSTRRKVVAHTYRTLRRRTMPDSSTRKSRQTLSAKEETFLPYAETRIDTMAV
jgi:hypothetical protein